MPEMLEVEYYRRQATKVVGLAVAWVTVDDPHVLAAPVHPSDLAAALEGRRFTTARRTGKVLFLDSSGDGASDPVTNGTSSRESPGPTLAMRFGMTGSLILDGRPALDRLLYAPEHVDRRWIVMSIGFDTGATLALHDPRRLARVGLGLDEERLGPDAATVSLAGLRVALTGRVPPRRGPVTSGAALKARMLDQSRLAGIGNLLADEILWRASLAPGRPAGSLADRDLRRLHRHLLATIGELLARGGSNTGDLMGERRPGGRCPRDGTELVRSKVGGRTTWWCPGHQH
ncbi:MAG: DNA-formamidopyrimidine glycosylase family protein [Acidimicrobiales bacterium]